jgi:lysozyme family protein
MTKDEIIAKTIGIEGGFSDHPLDSGGKTKYGITQALADKYHITYGIEDLPVEVALYVYSKEFWVPLRCEELLRISPEVTLEVFDTAVNTGPARAVGFLQRALNALNVNGKLYKDVMVDGVIGSRTIGAVQQYCVKRDPEVLTKLLNCLQGAYYVSLVEQREKDEAFIYGWIKNRIDT